MKVLIDAVHSADVWTLGAVEDRLLSAGETTLWLSRSGKDGVVELIGARGRPHVRASTAGTPMPALGVELVAYDWRASARVMFFFAGIPDDPALAAEGDENPVQFEVSRQDLGG